MAPCDKRMRRRLRSIDLFKLALIVITFSGVCLFMMVHDIENPYIQADLSLPINFEPDLQWNDSYFEGLGKTEETSDLLESDKTFQDLFNFHSDSAEEKTSTSKPPFQRKSNFRKRRSVSKSVRASKTTSELNRPGILDSRNGSVSQLDSQRQLAPIDSRRFSFNLRKSLDSERQPETIKSINDRPATTLRIESERFKQHSSNFQMEAKEKEQQSETVNLSNDETKQLEPLHLSHDEKRPKKAKIQEPYLPESQNNFHRQKMEKIPSSSQTNNSSSSRNLTSIDGIDVGKLQGKLNDRSLAGNQSFHLRDKSFRKSKYDDNSKGSITKRESLDLHQNITLNLSQKARSNSEQDSSKVALNHQGKPPPKITDNKQHSDPLPKTSSEKRRSLLIFGDDRSGTTFVTKMFAADPQMFTVYEPLWVTKKWFSNLRTGDQKKVQFTRDVVNALLSCQFKRSKAGKQFLSYTSSSWVGQGVFEKNVFRTTPFTNKTKSGKKTWPNLYEHPEFAEEVCLSKFNHSVVKVGQVRVPTESISVFIPHVFLANPDTDIRIIQIVRDPRGSINSRIKAGWISDFTFPGFSRIVGNLCSKIEANIRFGRNLETAWIKERYMEVNYREITSMPITTAKKIYKFAGFEMPDSLIDWIVKSTNPDENQLEQALNNPFSHVRDSRKNYLKWRSESPIKRVRVIEQQCRGLLDLLGLDAVADEMEKLCS